ncbi:MAG TPA: LysM peptidoglycan-binding domain-containing protein [Firmicutes bacterium]|jgi:LysM repeat protein|nr:LysM peptidoglycan-binding domain-containing protein [Bacillota bacterium]HHT42687.1 LysM peptidoglycan-binding domain-containing protein [Bacillota bacterium]
MGKVQNAIVSVSVLSLLIALLASVAAIVVKVIWINDTLAETGLERVYTEVVVQPGDSLWSIATAQMPGEDPRDAVGSIRQLNELQSAEIYPGQVLTLEVKRAVQSQQLASRP